MSSKGNIHYFFEDTSSFSVNEIILNTWIHSTIISETQSQIGDINIIFCSDKYLLEINIQYLKHNYFTDIITFQYDDQPLTGDLFISIERVKENARLANESFDNELNRVIIHGILHLCGLNDKTVEEQKLMRNKENYYLDTLKEIRI